MTERQNSTSANSDESARKPAGRAVRKTAPPATKAATKTVKTAATRRVSMGDVTGSTQPRRIAKLSTSTVVNARQEAKAAAVKDILADASTSKTRKAEGLRAILEGASPDDAKAIRRLLKETAQAARGRDKGESNPDEILSTDWRSGAYPYKNLLSRKVYESQKYLLQVELLKLQAWAKETGQRIVILFEGRDAAGKGGTIKRMMEHLNPRGARVVALEKPSEVERGQWYFQRYVQHLPTAGEIVLFDRSWYNRAGVEKVMGFCTDEEHRRFLREAPLFERMLLDDGIILFKYWLCVDQAEQEARFAERLADPLKRWKLSPVDVVARTKYAEYGKARNAMLKATHTEQAPWTLVDFNDQRLGRLTLIRHLLDHLPDQKVPEQTIDMPPLDGRPGKESYPVGHAPLPSFPLSIQTND